MSTFFSSILLQCNEGTFHSIAEELSKFSMYFSFSPLEERGAAAARPDPLPHELAAVAPPDQAEGVVGPAPERPPTLELATAALQKIVFEEAQKYWQEDFKEQDYRQQHPLPALLSKEKLEEDAENRKTFIWTAIQPKVRGRILAKFAPLFEGGRNNLDGFVAAGEYSRPELKGPVLDNSKNIWKSATVFGKAAGIGALGFGVGYGAGCASLYFGLSVIAVASVSFPPTFFLAVACAFLALSAYAAYGLKKHLESKAKERGVEKGL